MYGQTQTDAKSVPMSDYFHSLGKSYPLISKTNLGDLYFNSKIQERKPDRAEALQLRAEAAVIEKETPAIVAYLIMHGNLEGLALPIQRESIEFLDGLLEKLITQEAAIKQQSA